MTLTEQIDSKRREIFTDAYPMSIGELSNLYRDGEIYINPEFQRFYRWTESQKIKLIESIMLGIPLPSIFVAQRNDGIWELVDGLQRLSTIFSFMGILKGADGELLPALRLKATDDIPGFDGIEWGHDSFDKSLQMGFKREKIDVKIIKKESDINTKFELFQRLNTGGSNLSDQEVRNCLMLMINSDLFALISELSLNENFVDSVSMNERLKEQRFDMELVSRFIVQNIVYADSLGSIDDVNEFLTSGMKLLAEGNGFDLNVINQYFIKTFEYINSALADNAFKKWDGSRYKGAFSIAIYEIITSGVYFYLKNHPEFLNFAVDDLENTSVLIEKIRTVSREIITEEDFNRYSGSGSKASYRLPKLVPLGQRLFNQ
ncbi:TPA: DUF262 domain-containing protein [Aeromonas dhakensis]|nr:DUF262 domain-containing protein [Aeromonas dhakensis]